MHAILNRKGYPVETISDLPTLNDIDANYSPRYVELARTIRDKIRSSRFQRGDALRSADPVREHGVSARAAGYALAMLAANRYVARTRTVDPYRVARQARQ